jgi:hypothetical protein
LFRYVALFQARGVKLKAWGVGILAFVVDWTFVGFETSWDQEV